MSGPEIKATRNAFRLTQGQFGALFGVKGVSVCLWESGHQPPTSHQLSILERLGRAAGVVPRKHEDTNGNIGDIITNGEPVLALAVLLAESLGTSRATTSTRKKK